MEKFDVNDYQISFWNYVASHLQGAEMVDLMRSMGCTLYMSPEHKQPSGRNNMLAVLQRCETLHMPCIVYDHRVVLRVLQERGEEAYIRNLKEVYGEYKGFSSAAYCFICDEPNSDAEYEATFRACELMRKFMPAIRPFVSHNHVGMRSEKDGERVLERFMQKMKPDFLLYNCYSQCMEEPEDKIQGLENYFHNLYKFEKVSKRYKVPLWQSLLLCGHLCLADPTQAQLRWQLNVGAAHGVTGFFWFHPLELGYSYDARGHAVDNRGVKTQKYDQVAYESARFMNDIAPRLRHYDHEKTYHLHMAASEFESFYRDCDDVIADLSSLKNRPLVVGKFRHKEDPSRCAVMLVNGSQENMSHASIEFNKGGIGKDSLYLAPGTAKIYEVR